MRYHRALIAALASLALVGSALAQSDIGTTGAQFLNISPSARAVALGGAYGSLAKGADAVYSNPAALTGVKGPDLHLSHISYVAGVDVNYVAYAMPGMKGVIGVYFGAMSTGDMPVTTIQDPTNASGTTFDAGSWVAGLTYAAPLTDRLSLGVTAKILRESIWDMTSSSYAFDVGTLYYTGFSNWRFAAVLTNFGPSARFASGQLVTDYDKFDSDGAQSPTVAEDRAESYDLPLTFKISTAYDLALTEEMTLTTIIEGAHPSDANEYIAGGLEYSYALPIVSIAVRGGYRLVESDDYGTYTDERSAADGATLGLGVGVPFLARKLVFDYTWQDYSDLGTNHLFSIGMSF
jgi:hypothetical protein